METNNIKSAKVAGYIVRSATNTRNILCLDGEFYDESLVGVGQRSAKVFKRETNARKVRDGAVTTHPVNGYGIEISWLTSTFGVV